MIEPLPVCVERARYHDLARLSATSPRLHDPTAAPELDYLERYAGLPALELGLEE